MRAFRIAYDGRPFYGFQRQPNVPTVEDAILDALEALDVLDSSTATGAAAGGAASGESDRRTRPIPPGYAAAGRTDAGVSALAQTVAFEAPAWLTPRALNGELPDSIHAWAHADVPVGAPAASADFHATHDATRRRYAYHLHAPGADLDRATDALTRLAGEHDVAALTTDDTGTVRDLVTAHAWEDPYLVVQVEAGGFPRHLVRRIVALVELVAVGERPPAFVDRLLDDPGVPESEYPSTAPAEPLVLEAVAYPDLAFEVDQTAVEDAGVALAEQRVAASTRARTMDRIERGVRSGRRSDSDE